jgi:hypothetical protein
MNRDWYLKGILTAIALGLWVAILRPALLPRPSEAAGPARVVRSERFELVDATGAVRAVLGSLPGMMGSDGKGLCVYDRAGKPRAWLGFEDHGAIPGLYLLGPNEARVMLWSHDQSTPSFILRDQRQKIRFHAP